MNGFAGALRAELAKLRTIGLGYGLAGGSAALTAVVAFAFSWPYRHDVAGQLVPARLLARGPALGAFLFVLSLGVMVMAGEFRHRTADSTFLASPSRLSVVLAKAAVVAGASAVIGILCEVVMLGVSVPLLAHFGAHVSFGTKTLVDIAAVIVMIALVGVLGVGVASLARNQMGALVGVLAWLFVLEPILLQGLSRRLYEYVLGGILESVVGGGGPGYLSRPAGFALLLTYVLALCGAGAASLRKLDIS